MAKGQKILIVDHVLDLLTLFDTLLDQAGYKASGTLMDATVMERARGFGPDAILVDLIPWHSDDLDLLDHLRTDPTTRGTPVVAMSTVPDMLAQAVASYNVRQVLLKPFNVDDLLEKTRAALEGEALLSLLKGPLPVVKPIFAEVAMGLAAASRAMVVRWVQRTAATEPFRSHRLNLTAAIDQVPILLEAVLVALQSDNFRAILAQHPAIRDKVLEHVRLRRQQGIPLADIVREHQYLREEIRCEIAGILMGKNVTPEDTLEVVTRKDFALDTIIRLTIDVYEQEETER